MKKHDLKADKCVMYEKSKIDSCLECEARENCMRFVREEDEAESASRSGNETESDRLYNSAVSDINEMNAAVRYVSMLEYYYNN